MSKSFSDLFRTIVASNRYYHQAVQIARANSCGDIWIIGGFVFRNLTSVLYGGECYHSDIDIVISQPKVGDLYVPDGWTVKLNSYGTPKFVHENDSVDLPCLLVWDSIKRRNLEPTIENALSGTPLTIQSIAFSVDKEEIIGDIGMDAILSKTVAVNDRKQADHYASRKNKPLNQIIEEKANDLGFRPVIPPDF